MNFSFYFPSAPWNFLTPGWFTPSRGQSYFLIGFAHAMSFFWLLVLPNAIFLFLFFFFSKCQSPACSFLSLCWPFAMSSWLHSLERQHISAPFVRLQIATLCLSMGDLGEDAVPVAPGALMNFLPPLEDLTSASCSREVAVLLGTLPNTHGTQSWAR